MIANVVVAVDELNPSAAIIPYVKTIGLRTGAHITLVRPVPANEMPDHAGESQTQKARSAVAGTTIMEVAEERALLRSENLSLHSGLHQLGNYLERRGMTVSTQIAAGEPADVILDAAGLQNADLIMLAGHKQWGLERLLFGSVVETILEHTAIPVFWLRVDGFDPKLLLSDKQPRFVVPLDGTPEAESALPLACDLARAFGAQLCLLGLVVPIDALPWTTESFANWPVDGIESVFEANKRSTEAYLSKVAARVGKEGSNVRWDIRADKIPTGIVRASEELRASLIVMARHPHSILADVLTGSVCHRVLEDTNVPVVVMPSTPIH